jgi:negative regulator of sigma-B (phosphoserine phosphatase)
VATLRLASAARSYPGEDVNGDAWTAQSSGTVCRLAVIDGLGHGQAAAAAARAAVTFLEAHPDLPLSDTLQACHQALYGTRGAAMWLGLLDLEAHTLSVLGAGNVQARLWQAGQQVSLVTARGIVGAVLPRTQQQTYALAADWLLIAYTDGVRERFQLPELADGQRPDPTELAETILQRWSRPTDDATVVVACPTPFAG